MKKNEFVEISKRIESTMGKTNEKFTDLQFEEWWDSFKDEDFDVGMEAYKLMRDEYKYFPVVATFKAYIQRVGESRKAGAKTEKKKEEKEPSPEALTRYKRWTRFLRWCAEIGKFPKTTEEGEKMKADFEKNHPTWKPKKETEKQGPEPIGSIFKKREMFKGGLE